MAYKGPGLYQITNGEAQFIGPAGMCPCETCHTALSKGIVRVQTPAGTVEAAAADVERIGDDEFEDALNRFASGTPISELPPWAEAAVRSLMRQYRNDDEEAREVQEELLTNLKAAIIGAATPAEERN